MFLHLQNAIHVTLYIIRRAFISSLSKKNNIHKDVKCSQFKCPYCKYQRSIFFFSQPPLISLKRDKNVGNFLVRSALKTSEQPGTFKCARSRCKTCLFIVNTSKISGPKRSVKITYRFTYTSANVIYCITCTL